MQEKIFLHLLILCGIWSQGIFGTFANEQIKESPDFLLRHKRQIINEDLDPMDRIEAASYVVGIEHLRRIECVGNILSNRAVITAAVCLHMDPSQYRVISNEPYPNRGSIHNVREIRLRTVNDTNRAADGIGLVVVSPSFVFSHFCQSIPLHSVPVGPDTLGRIRGWGHMNNFGVAVHGRYQPRDLRTIPVRIIAHLQCVMIYRTHISISDRDICIRSERHVGLTDLGAGLEIGGFLAGIFIRGNIVNGGLDHTYPYIFASLNDYHYQRWIIENVIRIGG